MPSKAAAADNFPRQQQQQQPKLFGKKQREEIVHHYYTGQDMMAESGLQELPNDLSFSVEDGLEENTPQINGK